MWLRFKFSLFLPPLYFFLSLSLSLYFSVSRVPLSSLFNALPFLSTILHPFHFVFSPFFAPFSLSFYLPPPLLPRCVDIFFLFPVYNTFTTMPFFFSFLSLYSVLLYPFLFLSRISTRIFLLPYFSSTRTLSYSHSLTHFLTRSPSHLRQRHLHLLTPHSFSYAYSLAPFLSWRYRLCLTRGVGRVLSSLDNLPLSSLFRTAIS